MRSRALAITTLLSAALVVTAGASVQESATANTICVVDAVGDVVTRSGQVVDSPAYMDVTTFTIKSDSDDLVITFDLAADFESLLPGPVLFYEVSVDTDADDEADLWVRIGRDPGEWFAQVTDYDLRFDELAPPIVGADSISARVPLSALGALDDLRFRGLMWADDVSDELGRLEWFDPVPSDNSVWLAFGLDP